MNWLRSSRNRFLICFFVFFIGFLAQDLVLNYLNFLKSEIGDELYLTSPSK